MNAYVVGDTDKYLIISNTVFLDNKNKLSLVTTRSDAVMLRIYPSAGILNNSTWSAVKISSPQRNICSWKISLPEIKPEITLIQTDDRHFVLKAPEVDWTKVNDVFISFDYRGDRAICMMYGELQTDNLYTSKPWTIGLKRYGDALKSAEMYFHFIPMTKDAPYLSYLDKEVIPDFENRREFLEIKQPIIEVEYKLELELK